MAESVKRERAGKLGARRRVGSIEKCIGRGFSPLSAYGIQFKHIRNAHSLHKTRIVQFSARLKFGDFLFTCSEGVARWITPFLVEGLSLY